MDFDMHRLQPRCKTWSRSELNILLVKMISRRKGRIYNSSEKLTLRVHLEPTKGPTILHRKVTHGLLRPTDANPCWFFVRLLDVGFDEIYEAQLTAGFMIGVEYNNDSSASLLLTCHYVFQGFMDDMCRSKRCYGRMKLPTSCCEKRESVAEPGNIPKLCHKRQPYVYC